MEEKKKWYQIVLASRVFTVIGTLALAIFAFWIYTAVIRPTPPIQTTPGEVIKPPPPSKEITRIIERAVPVPGPKEIVYLPNAALANTLKMPELNYIKDNVIAVAEAAPHRGKTTVIATIGPDADNVYRGGILLRKEPVPFWGLQREWHGGVYYGVVGRTKFQGEIEFLPLRIGPVYPSAKGTLGIEEGGGLNGQVLIGVRY